MRREQILLVEDDHAVQEVLTVVFKDAYEVKGATTGAEALAILDQEGVAAVVLDYRLPDCTGLELLNKIKAIQPSLPVVMITGYGSEWICAAALKLGVRDYFPKPFNAFDLVCSVRRILSGAAQAREHRENVLGEIDGRPHLSPKPSLRQDLTIQKAIRLIQQRYWDDLSLSELACQVGMSKFLFSRRFREVMGMTFREYLTKIRLEKAKELLPGKQLSITEVAQVVGFGDLPRFDKLFKRHTGVTPSAYRTQDLASSAR